LAPLKAEKSKVAKVAMIARTVSISTNVKPDLLRGLPGLDLKCSEYMYSGEGFINSPPRLDSVKRGGGTQNPFCLLMVLFYSSMFISN
jgi:hypothetical protein